MVEEKSIYNIEVLAEYGDSKGRILDEEGRMSYYTSISVAGPISSEGAVELVKRRVPTSGGEEVDFVRIEETDENGWDDYVYSVGNIEYVYPVSIWKTYGTIYIETEEENG